MQGVEDVMHLGINDTSLVFGYEELSQLLVIGLFKLCSHCLLPIIYKYVPHVFTPLQKAP
jgi:hypothetical protein